MYNFD